MAFHIVLLLIGVSSHTCLALTTIAAPPCLSNTTSSVSASGYPAVNSSSYSFITSLTSVVMASSSSSIDSLASSIAALPSPTAITIAPNSGTSIASLSPLPTISIPPDTTAATTSTTTTPTIPQSASTCTTIPYSGTSTPPDPTLDFQDGMLVRTNYLRQFHSAPNMTWSSTLAAVAQVEVDTCVFSHTVDDPYGENLAAFGRTGGYTASELVISVDAWYAEISSYNFSDPGYSASTGHFTQLVWVGSSELGCAWNDCTDTPLGLYFVACEYNPRGNIENPGYFEANVLPPLPDLVDCS